jgi:TIR domain
MDLAVFADYHRADQERVRQICEFLYKERNFDVWLDIKDIRPGTLWEKEIQKGIADRLNRGGYLVVFWSNEAESRSKSIQEALATAASGIEGVNDRVLFALLEPCDLPKFWEQFQEPSVQLYGDSERSATHRIDDLVVRLYWLIYRKTKISHETPAASL